MPKHYLCVHPFPCFPSVPEVVHGVSLLNVKFQAFVFCWRLTLQPLLGFLAQLSSYGSPSAERLISHVKDMTDNMKETISAI